MESQTLKQKVVEARERAKEMAKEVTGRAMERMGLRAEDPERAEARALKRATRSRWNQTVHAARAVLTAHIPERHRSVYAECLADLEEYDMLQPTQATMNRTRVKERMRQWRAVQKGEGGVDGRALWPIWGAALGLVVTFQFYGQLHPVVAIPLAPAGALIGWAMSQNREFTRCMIKVVLNERLSPITPEVVTATTEFWIPKLLVAFRADEWQRDQDGGLPYLLLYLPDEKELHQSILYPYQVITLPSDPFKGKSDALYGRRNLNRMVGKNAKACREAEEEQLRGPEETGLLQSENLVWLLAAGIAICGVLAILFTRG